MGQRQRAARKASTYATLVDGKGTVSQRAGQDVSPAAPKGTEETIATGEVTSRSLAFTALW